MTRILFIALLILQLANLAVTGVTIIQQREIAAILKSIETPHTKP